MLFDKNGFYMVDSKYDGIDFTVDLMNGNMDSPKIYSLEEALKKGNLFPNLYDPYMSYEPKNPKANNERERLLYEIQKLDFAINDLNLYLDLNPNDTSAFKMFRNYVMDCKKKKENYNRIFGPLTLDEVTDEYEWSTGVWPWEEGGM